MEILNVTGTISHRNLLFSKCVCVCVCVCVVVPQLMEKSNPVRKLAGKVAELGSGLEKVKTLLEQKSPTVNDAQNALKVQFVSRFTFTCV